MSTQKLGFGFQDDQDDSLKGKGMDGQFGLNQNVRLSLFKYNPNAGKDESAADAIDITIKIGDTEFRRRIYDITKVYDGNNGEVTDTTSDKYIKLYNEAWTQNSAMITHVLKAFVTEEVIKQALATPLSSFADWAKVVTALVPDNHDTIPLDAALQYQWTIPEGKDMTYLELPKNMKGGYWLCKAQPGVFKPETLDNGSLVYKNEQGLEHPFTRDKNFMESAKAIQQNVNDTLTTAASAGNTPAKSGNW